MSAGRAACTVTIDGVRFPSPAVPPCDVLLDGRRILSLAPARGTTGPDGRSLVPWPAVVQPYLRGTGRVTVREHGSREVLFDDDVAFDSSTERPSVVDGFGEPLAVSKWGRLERSFEDSFDAKEQIEMTQRLLRDLNDKVGVSAYAAYGTLLGAVRAGAVIGHDFDADISYLSVHSHPADIARESFRVQRQLRDLGWTVERGRLGKLVVKQLHNVDIFVSYFFEERYHLDMWVEGPLRRDQVLPLSSVVIEGYELPAPADPEAMLALNYGPGWATPDPSFKYNAWSPHLARVRGWFGGITAHKIPWEAHWRKLPDPNESRPSPFAQEIADRLDPDAVLLDVGCGLGVDTVHFARRGVQAIGYDFLSLPLTRARDATSASGVVPAPQFRLLSLPDTRAALSEGARVAAMRGPKTVYARMVLDALPPDGYFNFWRFLRMATAQGGTAYLEFRAQSGPAFDDLPQYVFWRVPSLHDVCEQIARVGGVVIEERTVPGNPEAGVPVATRRVVARWEVS